MSETAQGGKSRWPLIVGAAAGVLVVLLVFGSLIVKRRMDRICVDGIAFDLADIRSEGGQPFEPEVFDRCLAVLDGVQAGALDPAATQMMLPTVRAWFWKMGFRAVPVTEAQAEDLGAKAEAVLVAMTGKDLGRDPAAWRDWLATRTSE